MLERICVTLTFIALLGVAPTQSQEHRFRGREWLPDAKHVATYEEQHADGKYFRSLKPEEIPTHSLIFNLLHHGSLWMERHPAPEAYHTFLQGMGLEPGTEAADVFTYAVLDARDVIRTKQGKGEDPLDHEEWKVRQLAGIYARLLVLLEAKGVPATVIEDFIESDIRGPRSWSSTTSPSGTCLTSSGCGSRSIASSRVRALPSEPFHRRGGKR